MRPGSELRVLVVDDERGLCEVVRDGLTGHRVTITHSGPDALRRLRAEHFDVVLLDFRLPGMSGLEVLRALKRDGVRAEVVILTGHGTVEGAVTAMRLGARDYLQKPIDLGRLRQVVSTAAEAGRSTPEGTTPRPEATARPEAMARPEGAARRPPGGDPTFPVSALLGVDPKMLTLRTRISHIAPTMATVLITGETGTGKEVVARMVHAGSERAARPFVVVDCPSVPVSLFESEVFGHERGAFTGAVSKRRGKLEAADGGTLFLDEVGDLTEAVQPKFLRFLQERRVEPIGGNRSVRVDTRVIGATNRDLPAMVDEGRFRADLFHRLNVVHLELPPLRDRKGDIPLLIVHFVDRFCQAAAVPSKSVSAECLTFFEGYDWPGNVRELENVIQQACILTRGAVITPESLPPRVLGSGAPVDGATVCSGRTLDELDRQHIVAVLREEQWNISRAARVLGIHRATLYRRLLAAGLSPEIARAIRRR